MRKQPHNRRKKPCNHKKWEPKMRGWICSQCRVFIYGDPKPKPGKNRDRLSSND